ncbi:MAG: hypothetical protein ACPGVN_01795 [Alphaproteobacteria bacterium]
MSGDTPTNESWLPVWKDKNGDPLACKDKLSVLNSSFSDLKQEAQDVLEDAVLIGCDESQIRETLQAMLDQLENPFVGNK